MKVASVTVKAISHGLYLGFQGASKVSVTFFLLEQRLGTLKKVKGSPLRLVR
jgi:hypothetical protein